MEYQKQPPGHLSRWALIAWHRGFNRRMHEARGLLQPTNGGPYIVRHMREAWQMGYDAAKAQEK